MLYMTIKVKTLGSLMAMVETAEQEKELQLQSQLYCLQQLQCLHLKHLSSWYIPNQSDQIPCFQVHSLSVFQPWEKFKTTLDFKWRCSKFQITELIPKLWSTCSKSIHPVILIWYYLVKRKLSKKMNHTFFPSTVIGLPGSAGADSRIPHSLCLSPSYVMSLEMVSCPL